MGRAVKDAPAGVRRVPAPGSDEAESTPIRHRLQWRIHASPTSATPHAGPRAAIPRSQWTTGRWSFRTSRRCLATASVMMTPRSPAEEDRIHDTAEETSVRPPEDPSRPKNARTQAGSSAVSPRSQYPVDGTSRRPRKTSPAPEPRRPQNTGHNRPCDHASTESGHRRG